MIPRLLVIGGAVLGLAACQNSPYETSGSSYAPRANYDSPRAALDAEEGCASGQPADFLHQNRPGGSDYSPYRCRTQGN